MVSSNPLQKENNPFVEDGSLIEGGNPIALLGRPVAESMGFKPHYVAYSDSGCYIRS